MAQLYDGDGQMKTMRFFAILVVVALALSSCGREYPYQFNAKFTVTVDTPEGVKTGSTVVHRKVIYPDPSFKFMLLPEARGPRIEFSGEAIVVELSNNRFLFLLMSDNFVNNASRELNYKDFPRDIEDDRVLVKKIQEQIDAVRASGAVQEVPPELYPYFVTFDNIKNPDKLIKVDPANLAATLGSGYSLKSLTMTYTDEPVTTGKVIAAVGDGFFEKWDAQLLSRLDTEWPRYRDDFGQMLYRDTFIIGEDKNGR